MPCNIGLPPRECGRGTRPSQAANGRPRLKQFVSPREAINALAVIGPIPGMAAHFRLASFSLCQTWICPSNSFTWRSSTSKLSLSRASHCRNNPGSSFSPSSNIRGTCFAMGLMPFGIVMPYSISKPRIGSACAVLAVTNP